MELGLIITGIIVLLGFSAFFSGSETALMSLSRPQIKRLEHGGKSERNVLELLKHPQHLLATILVGNMFVNNLLTLLCAILIAQLVEKLAFLQTNHSRELGVIVLNILIVTPLLMVFGELTPKTVAHRVSLPLAKISAPLLKFAGIVMTPILWFFQIIVTCCQWILRIPSQGTWDMLTKDEVSATLSASVEDGATSQPTYELLQRILRFDDIPVSEIMVPRIHIVGLDDSLTLHEAFEQIKHSSHNFIPVYHEDFDDIWGVALFTDYPIWKDSPESSKTLADFREQLEAGNASTPLPVYPIDFIPPSAKIVNVLESMKERPKRFNVVVGEYGGTLGIITMNSILEEIIGRFSPKDKAGNHLNPMSSGSYTADGMTRLRLVTEAIGEDFGETESDTLGGLIMERLGSLPHKGQFIDIGTHRFIVVRMRGNRITKVAIINKDQKKLPGKEANA